MIYLLIVKKAPVLLSNRKIWIAQPSRNARRNLPAFPPNATSGSLEQLMLPATTNSAAGPGSVPATTALEKLKNAAIQYLKTPTQRTVLRTQNARQMLTE